MKSKFEKELRDQAMGGWLGLCLASIVMVLRLFREGDSTGVWIWSAFALVSIGHVVRSKHGIKVKGDVSDFELGIWYDYVSNTIHLSGTLDGKSDLSCLSQFPVSNESYYILDASKVKITPSGVVKWISVVKKNFSKVPLRYVDSHLSTVLFYDREYDSLVEKCGHKLPEPAGE